MPAGSGRSPWRTAAGLCETRAGVDVALWQRDPLLYQALPGGLSAAILHHVYVIESPDEAVEVAMAHLQNASWEPAITQVEDAGSVWRIFYNSRAYVETNEIKHALGGNLPLLIDKKTEAVTPDASFLPRWKARIRFRLLSHAEGGRSHPIASGYRPAWRSERKPDWNDAAVRLDGVANVGPGSTADGWLLPGTPHLWAGQIVPGDRLLAGEGSRPVAEADVVEVTLWHAKDDLSD